MLFKQMDSIGSTLCSKQSHIKKEKTGFGFNESYFQLCSNFSE
jgi:hypothetical protein